MNKQELVTTLKILKSDTEPQKGFSFRRTLSALQEGEKSKKNEDFRNQLLKASGVIEDE